MSQISTTADVAQSLRPLFRMWPGFLLGEALIMLASAFWEKEILFQDYRPFDWNVCGKSIALLYILAPLYFLILLLLEFCGDGGSGGSLGQLVRSVRKAISRARLRLSGIDIGQDQLEVIAGSTLDEDVEKEKELVENSSSLEDIAPIVIDDLWKVFPRPVSCCGKGTPRLAVRGLSASIQKGEIFGLLGSNVSPNVWVVVRSST